MYVVKYGDHALESRQAPSYKSLEEARGLTLGSEVLKHKHETCKLRAT
jgi:hypothetical protein